jgi:excisionase family DNA binding protein
MRDYLTVKDAAAYLRVSKGTLDKFRHFGGGPEFIRVTARTIRYERGALDAWMAERRQAACAEYMGGEAA